MQPASFAILASMCCCFVAYVVAEGTLPAEANTSGQILGIDDIRLKNEDSSTDAILNRQKRTLLLKKKLLGAGLLGFGLGIAKGYKAGYYTAPQVHHVYLSPPPPSVKYVEYIEKPVFVERIIEKPAPVLRPIHKEPAPYGAW